MLGNYGVGARGDGKGRETLRLRSRLRSYIDVVWGLMDLCAVDEVMMSYTCGMKSLGKCSVAAQDLEFGIESLRQSRDVIM